MRLCKAMQSGAGRRAPMRFAKCHARPFSTPASSHEQSRVFYTRHKMSLSHACPTPWKCNCIRRPLMRNRDRGWHRGARGVAYLPLAIIELKIVLHKNANCHISCTFLFSFGSHCKLFAAYPVCDI